MDRAEHDHLEIWVRMYEEQVRHARHHESLRSTSTDIAVVVTAAALGLFAADVTSDHRWLLALSVMLINVYGLLMSQALREKRSAPCGVRKLP